MVPFSLFSDMSKKSSAVIFDKEDGIAPVSRFWSSHNEVNLVKLEMEEGILPASAV